MFGIEKDYQKLLEQVYGPLGEKPQMTEIEKVKEEIKVLEKKLSFLEELEKTKSPVEEAFKDNYGVYPNELKTTDDFNCWKSFKRGYNAAYEEKVSEWQPTPQTPEKVADGLKEAFREAVEQGIIPPVEKPKESWMDKPIDELVDMLEKNPPDCLKFQLGKTLEQIIERWWCDVFTSKKYDWDMETVIQDLCDRVFLWLPKEQDSSGTQRIETIVAVDAHNELLNKIKSKIHNKK